MRNTLLGAVLIGLVFALPVSAAVVRTGDSVSVTQQESLDDDFYAVGGTVTIGGGIKGDVYAGGGTIILRGPIGADLVAGGGTVTILSSVADDVRVGGGTLLIDGPVGGDIFAGGGTIHIGSPTVGGDIYAGGGTIRVEAMVAGDVHLGGGEVIINGPISGNVVVESDSLELGSNAVIAGKLTYTGPKEAVMQEGAQVLGGVEYKPRAEGGDKDFLAAIGVLGLLMSVVGAFFFGLLFRRYVHTLADNTYNRPWAQLGWGFATLILMPIIGILLMVTLVGIPLGVLTFLGYIALLIMSWLVAPVVLGSILWATLAKVQHREINWKTILLGVAVFHLLGFIPIVGWCVQLVFIVMTLGAAVRLKTSLLKEWR